MVHIIKAELCATQGLNQGKNLLGLRVWLSDREPACLAYVSSITNVC